MPENPVDFAALRRRFPLLKERVYFATQSLGPILDETLEDLQAYGRTLQLRKRAIPEWIGRVHELTGLIETLLGAPPNSVALRDSATACQAAIAAAVSPVGSRNRIVISDQDFHSSRYLWQAQARRGFEVIDITSGHGQGHEQRQGLERPAEALLSAVDERTAVVAVSLVSPWMGGLLDAGPLLKRAHDVGALLVLDAYQAVGIVPIDVQKLDADVVVGGTHKWLCGGGTGLAFMYVAPRLIERLHPFYPGWMGHQDPTGFTLAYSPAPGARRFQQGMPAMEPIYTARAGLRLTLSLGVEAIRQRNQLLVNRLMAQAGAAGLPIGTPPAEKDRGGTLRLPVENPGQIEAALGARGIDVDSRPQAGLRISPHFCNTLEECDQVISAIAACVKP